MTLDTDEVVELYEGGMSGLEVGDELGVTSAAVYHHLDKAGVETRQSGIDDEDLVELYVDEEMTMEEVAEELGCATSTVSYRLREAGVETRSIGARRKDLPVDEIIERWQDGASLNELAEKYDTGRNTISVRVKERGYVTGAPHKPERLGHYLDEYRRLEDELGREPTKVEYRALAGLSPDTILVREALSWSEFKELAD